MSLVNLNLSVGYHNIEGLHHAVLGCKIHDYITFINDIEILAETWSECETCRNTLSVGDYKIISNIDPVKKGARGRKSGGIRIFCKSYFEKHIEVVKTTEKYAWLKINKDIFYNMSDSVMLCAIYSQPYRSTYYSDDAWDELEGDIVRLTSNGKPFAIIGDMNGRVGTESEFQSINKHDHDQDPSLLCTSRDISETPRNNCDKKDPCYVGRMILELCKSYDMQIGNGRTKGDFLGNYTHHNKNSGQSTVDLALISDALFTKINDFQVLPQPVFSDHCKIILTINNLKPPEKAMENKYNWREASVGYKWDKDSPEKLRNALESITISNLVDECKTHITNKEIKTAGILIQDIFIKAADTVLEKKKSSVQKSRNGKRKKPIKKWFDEDCLRLKKETNSHANKKHKTPWNTQIQTQHRHVLKKFRAMCRAKKVEFWKEEARKIENLQGNNIEFWKKWKNIGEEYTNKDQFPEDIDGKKWENFFRGLFTEEKGDIESILSKDTKPTNIMLNAKITKEELIRIIKSLKKGKAVGNDRIANEFLQVCPDKILDTLLDYLNLNLEVGKTCADWCIGIISLIHKDGPRDDPNNYRGICVMNALLKVLCTLLNERLTDYCEEAKLIDIAQIGFKRESRTTDHTFTLKTVVNKYVVDKEGQKLYACFVDFQKAFDSVWHDGLFRKLENLGINGNFLNLIINIYKHTKCAVKINRSTTQFFDYNKGVLQGNPLSPILFNLFINEIFKTVKNEDSMLTLDDTHFFNALMYADDLILLSPTAEGLQQSLNSLGAFCQTWKLNINIKKTKCMTFSNGHLKKLTTFYINNTPIDHTTTYKYLGITIKSIKCSFKPTLDDLSTRANKAIYALRAKLPFKALPIKTLLKVFDACITPILLYGSELWEPYTALDWKKWEESKIERVHTQFLKRLLGVNTSTTNVMARAELGRHSLQELITRRCIRYITHVEGKDEEYLCRQAYKYELDQINELNERPNLLDKLITMQKIPYQDICIVDSEELKARVREEFDIAWKTQLESYSKSVTFQTFKDKVKFEPYLEEIKNRSHRVAMTKFRLSDHCLMIEKGRHRRPIIPRDQRYCPFCPGQIEDETHFLTQCIGYDREELLINITPHVQNYVNLNPNAQLVYLMTQEDHLITYKLALTINKWLTERKQFQDDLAWLDQFF